MICDGAAAAARLVAHTSPRPWRVSADVAMGCGGRCSGMTTCMSVLRHERLYLLSVRLGYSGGLEDYFSQGRGAFRTRPIALPRGRNHHPSHSIGTAAAGPNAIGIHKSPSRARRFLGAVEVEATIASSDLAEVRQTRVCGVSVSPGATASTRISEPRSRRFESPTAGDGRLRGMAGWCLGARQATTRCCRSQVVPSAFSMSVPGTCRESVRTPSKTIVTRASMWRVSIGIE